MSPEFIFASIIPQLKKQYQIGYLGPLLCLTDHFIGAEICYDSQRRLKSEFYQNQLTKCMSIVREAFQIIQASLACIRESNDWLAVQSKFVGYS